MRDLGIGRTPLREAVKRLALENLVAVQPRSGTYVTGVDAADIVHIAEVRAELEAHAAELAARRLDGELRERGRGTAGAGTGVGAGRTQALMGLDEAIHRLDLGGLAQPVPDRDAGALLRALAARLVRRARPRAGADHGGARSRRPAGRRCSAATRPRARELMREHVIAFEREIVAAFSRA